MCEIISGISNFPKNIYILTEVNTVSMFKKYDLTTSCTTIFEPANYLTISKDLTLLN